MSRRRFSGVVAEAGIGFGDVDENLGGWTMTLNEGQMKRSVAAVAFSVDGGTVARDELD